MNTKISILVVKFVVATWVYAMWATGRLDTTQAIVTITTMLPAMAVTLLSSFKAAQFYRWDLIGVVLFYFFTMFCSIVARTQEQMSFFWYLVLVVIIQVALTCYLVATAKKQ